MSMKEWKEEAKIKVEYMVGMLIAFLVAVQLLPSAINMTNNSSTFGWGGTLQSVWFILPLVVIVAIVLQVIRKK